MARGAEIEQMLLRMRVLQESHGLVAADLVAGFISRRFQPLQRRCHWMCDMTLKRDPTRTSTIELTREQVISWVMTIAELKLSDDWWFGMEPYCQNNAAPKVNHPLDDCFFCISYYFVDTRVDFGGSSSSLHRPMMGHNLIFSGLNRA